MEGDALREQMAQDNAYFKRVLDLIPVQFYFAKEKKYMRIEAEDTDDGVQPNTGHKREGEELSERAAWKRKRYDPSHIKTVSQLQEDLMESNSTAKKNDKKHKKQGSGRDLHPILYSSNEPLQQKLHTVIDEKRAKRGALKGSDATDKKQKRKDGKVKSKQKRKAEKQLKVKQSKEQVGKTPTKSPSKKPIYNNNGKMVFSKFDFTDSGHKDKMAAAPVGKDYKKLLEKAERQKEKISKLKQTDETKAKQLAEKTQWKNMLQRAEGQKVRDDPEMLKRALKNADKRKDRRKEKWGDRDQKVKDTLKEKQDKRKTNIGKRKQEKRDKKIQKAKKKGRMIPGF